MNDKINTLKAMIEQKYDDPFGAFLVIEGIERSQRTYTFKESVFLEKPSIRSFIENRQAQAYIFIITYHPDMWKDVEKVILEINILLDDFSIVDFADEQMDRIQVEVIC